MTSRVQKGGPIFKPLARQKSRPASTSQGAVSRQPSVVAEQEQIAPHFPSSTASVSLQGQRIGSAAPSIVLDASQAPLFAPKSVVVPTVAPSVSMPPPAPNPATSITMSQQRISPGLLSSIVPTASSVMPIPLYPPRPEPIALTSPTSPSVFSSPTSNVLHSSPTENTLVQTTPPTTLNVERYAKPSQRGDVGPDENGEDPSGGNAIHQSPKGGRSRMRTRRSLARDNTTDEEGGTIKDQPIKRRKRTTKSKQNSTGDTDLHNVQKPRSKRRRKTRSPSLPPFDPDADPGEEIDPTVVTMASLCSDTGQGRVSSKAQEILNNHASWRASNRERRARMKIMMERKKYGQPEDEDVPTEASNSASVVLAADPSQSRQPSPSLNNVASTSNSAAAVVANADSDSFDYTQNLAASRFNVQVRIGPNGETIIDEESLLVDRAGDAEDDTSGYTHVIESDRSRFTNSSTYGTKLRGTRWSAAETELFYEALSQYGENYELISYVLPGRDRKSCKNKFKAEDKKNPARINHCLNNSVPVDITTLSRMTGRDFSGPTPEIAMPAPAEPVASLSTVQVDSSSSGGASTQDRHRDITSSSKSRKRSRSRTAGPPEEGLMVIGDLDTFVEHST